MVEPWLNADGAVDVHHGSLHGLSVEAAGDPVVGVEARSSDVDDGSTEHVAALRGEHEREICSV